jgi:hypothetical protein
VKKGEGEGEKDKEREIDREREIKKKVTGTEKVTDAEIGERDEQKESGSMQINVLCMSQKFTIVKFTFCPKFTAISRKK